MKKPMQPYYQHKTTTIYQADALMFLKAQPDNSVDALVTDPPYGCTKLEWDRYPTQEELTEMLRVSKGAVIMFGAALPRCQAAVLSLDPQPERTYIWNNSFTRTNSEGAFYCWQPFYVWRKKHLQDMNFDLIRMAAHAGGDLRYHPTQKPVPLMQQIVECCTEPGDTVLDVFNGSGTTGVACVSLDRHYIGVEGQEQFCKISARRLKTAHSRYADIFSDVQNESKEIVSKGNPDIFEGEHAYSMAQSC